MTSVVDIFQTGCKRCEGCTAKLNTVLDDILLAVQDNAGTIVIVPERIDDIRSLIEVIYKLLNHIYFAGRHRHPELAEILLDTLESILMSNVVVVSVQGRMLHMVAMLGHARLVALLLQKGADATERLQVFGSVLSYVEDKDCVQLLVDHGAPLGPFVQRNAKPVLATVKNVEAAKVLLRAGAHICDVAIESVSSLEMAELYAKAKAKASEASWFVLPKLFQRALLGEFDAGTFANVLDVLLTNGVVSFSNVLPSKDACWPMVLSLSRADSKMSDDDVCDVVSLLFRKGSSPVPSGLEAVFNTSFTRNTCRILEMMIGHVLDGGDAAEKERLFAMDLVNMAEGFDEATEMDAGIQAPEHAVEPSFDEYYEYIDWERLCHDREAVIVRQLLVETLKRQLPSEALLSKPSP